MRRAVLLAVAALAAVSGLAAAEPQWLDVSKLAGVQFRQAGEVHPPDPDGPSTTWPAFPEIIGGGACWLDHDGDGWDDLYLVSQQYNPHNPHVGPWAAGADPHSRLFRSDGHGRFLDMSAAAGVDTRAFAYGCSAADYDGDGCVDLFVSVFGASEMFRNNCDGTFANVTAEVGAPIGVEGACGDHPCMSTSSAWADYDRDGDLDLYVCNYVDTNLTDAERGPVNHRAQLNWLLRNHGDGTFTEVGVQAGVAGDTVDGKSLGAAWFDYDLDGWPDLFVANDEHPAYLFRNARDGTFASVAEQAGVADGRANMGVATGDYDNDGWPDLFITHYQGQEAGFYRNNQDGTFEDRSGEDDLTHLADYVGWGDAFADIDRDGDLDLVAANGHTEWTAPDNYDEPVLVFRSDPSPKPLALPWDRQWVDVTAASGPGATQPYVHRGAAFADYDLDGNGDIALNNNGNETAQLLHGSGNTNHWLYVRLAQPGMNRFAIGARIVLEAGGLAQAREVQAGSSYLSQNTLTQEFGLGAAPEASRITVTWPDGGTTVVEHVAANQTVRIDRSAGPSVATHSAGNPPGGPLAMMPSIVPVIVAGAAVRRRRPSSAPGRAGGALPGPGAPRLPGRP